MTPQMLNQYLDGLMMMAIAAFLTVIIVAAFVGMLWFIWDAFRG